MIVEQITFWFFRLMGALWIVGAVFLLRQLWFNKQLDPMIAALEKAAQELGAPPAKAKIDVDNGRERWLAAGAALTLACGVAMAVPHRAAVALLAACIVQQLAYFIRQRRRELRAPNAVEAAQERPTQQTVNGFYTSLAMAVLAAWLYSRGMLL